ncbi:MAG: nuclear transport factor 2 family protein [Terracidiphilus sp.]
METSILPIQPAFARQFTQEWIDSWNSHDLDRILAHYADDVALSSPVALQRLGGDGVVRGKPALCDYFTRGLQAIPDLRFDLIEVLWGTETIVVLYRNNHRGTKSAEVMQLNAAGNVIRVWANYDQ